MSVVSTAVGSVISYAVGSSGFLFTFVMPVILFVIILWLCKRYNFSILPSDLKGKAPPKFKLPKVSRKQVGNRYMWFEDDQEHKAKKSESFRVKTEELKKWVSGEKHENMYE